MQLYFLRHGDAAPSTGSDHDRPLTDKGVRRTRTAAAVMAAMKLNPTVIYSSPRLRASQTAEIVAAALQIEVQIHEAVNFGFDVAAVEKLVQENPSAKSLMFVGHQPSMSAVLHDLTGARIDMKKGGLARVDLLERDAMVGLLAWLIAPKVFDALRG